MSKDLWIDEHERIGDEYAAGEIDREEAESRMRGLGFDAAEIQDQLDTIAEESGCDDTSCYQCRGTGMPQSGPPDAPGNFCSFCGGSGEQRKAKMERDPDNDRDDRIERQMMRDEDDY